MLLTLHARALPGDDWEPADAYWLLTDDDGKPAGFCSARKLSYENGIYLVRAGLLKGARGAGIQRRMIQARLAWGRKEGAEYAMTYTAIDNYPSIANLLKCGFRFHEPAHPWLEGPVHYFFKAL